ncbi:hypothetical protein E0H36_05325 [Rhizobium leguminosarum bv. viciae]|uniref:hypothetical protein n=1 Tax=Rhizobium leguminosarum TaxID=384 RepID=UPI00103A417F|nr:hypothetical protein [Rhizobium leguminosarum]TBZ36444.1 hypothetical protein E0H36_05325 [Rhizobium leguminosarum bv. viciae]
MVPKLDQPENLRLYGSEDSREADRLRIEFDPVDHAEQYIVSVDDVDRATPILSGSWIDALTPNTDYKLEVKAQAAGYEDSDFSVPFIGTTRPPIPPKPQRMPYDLQGWGIVLDWSVSAWPGSALAKTRLYRRDDGGSWNLLTGNRELADRYIDTGYPFGVVKDYALTVVVPSTTVAENESGLSAFISATGPLAVPAVGGLPSVIQTAEASSRRLGRRLIGLSYLNR